MNSKKAQISLVAIFLAFTFILTGAFFIIPKKDYSSQEKRYLAKFPEISLENFLSGKFTSSLEGGENGGYIPDHFPFRSFFVGLNSYANLVIGSTASNGYYYADEGYIITKPPKYDSAAQNLRLINDFAASFDEVNLMVVPSPGYILEDKLPLNRTDYPDKEVYSTLSREKADNVNLINLENAFKSENEKGTQLYYRTDHHWTSAGAYLGYTELCGDMGLSPVKADSLTVSKYENFYGTTYSSSGYFLTAPDTLEIWENEELNRVKVNIIEGKEKKTFDSMYFPAHLEEDDMYPVFLDGNHALTEIENPASESDRSLVIVKDSYAHCMAPFLVNNYQKVVMVDLRYYKDSVSKLCDENTDILFLYGMNNFTTDKNLAFLQ
ncbi:MAG: DHHW family protein [Eubacteriales bacterium]|nr:DHHW family protein [Eubacteriales bacterium]